MQSARDSDEARNSLQRRNLGFHPSVNVALVNVSSRQHLTVMTVDCAIAARRWAQVLVTRAVNRL